MITEITFKHILLLVIMASTCVSATAASDAVTNVWINEIHYDNDGADTNEGVEVAGPAGTDLSAFKLYLYNGSNGETYGTHPLSGEIENQTNSYGTKWVAIEAIQNGAPDGVALVFEKDSVSRVIQFISYEGTIKAQNGPAKDTESTDIGVMEEATQKAGLSLQLYGKGRSCDNFKWMISTATPGAINTGQVLNPPEPTVILLRSVDPGDLIQSSAISRSFRSPVSKRR